MHGSYCKSIKHQSYLGSWYLWVMCKSGLIIISPLQEPTHTAQPVKICTNQTPCTQTDPQNNFMHYISTIEDKSKGKTVRRWSCCGGGGVLHRALSLSLFSISSPPIDSSGNIEMNFSKRRYLSLNGSEALPLVFSFSHKKEHILPILPLKWKSLCLSLGFGCTV